MKSKLKIYNTLTHQLEEFVPLKEGEAKIYSCGPTVYNFAHIGNFRSYIFSDILRRTLKLLGYNVTHVMNITDVDDKTINGANKQGVSLNEFTKGYIEEFHKDLATLGIEKVEHYPRATEHIPEMIGIIQKLEKNGLTYVADGSVYFSIKNYKDYGKLSGNRLSGDRDGARIDSDEYEKENAKDFVLWKAKKEENEPSWQTPWGEGRPGWHIECSAMSMKYLGETFDIHTGGFDLVFPHHENEIAQSEGATGKTFVNYWMHCSHLIVEGEKMSKSKGNFYTLRDVLAKGYSAAAVRYVLLSAHYRKNLNFTFDSIKQAEQSVAKFNDFYHNLKKSTTVDGGDVAVDLVLENINSGFIEGLADDLNVSLSLSAMFELISEFNRVYRDKPVPKNTKEKFIQIAERMNMVLGILDTSAPAEVEVPAEIMDLVEQRKAARAAKDWAGSDRIRNEIKAKGWVVEDGKEGMKVKKG